MAPEAIDNTWLPALESELRTEDSDVTIRDSIENPQKDLSQYKYRLMWGNTEVSAWETPINNRFPYIEERADVEEELLTTITSHLGILREQIEHSVYCFYKLTGVINGYIFKPKISVSETISPEVVAESEANGWTEELETAIELAKTTYTSLKKIELLLEKDPEITDRETIRFILTVSGNPEKILEEESKFKKHLRSKIRQHTRENITITHYWK